MSVEQTRAHPGINLNETDSEAHEAAEPAIFGFWIFLMSDLIIFATLFATYAAMSRQGIANGPSPADIFSLGKPLVETLVLLISSFTIGIAVLRMKYDSNATRTLLWLAVTALLGLVFVGLEAHEFYSMVVDDHASPQTSGFLSAFFLLVGMHGVHVLGGILWSIILGVQLLHFGLIGMVKLRIMRLALFWHMLDIVWVCIFTFVYLTGVLT